VLTYDELARAAFDNDVHAKEHGVDAVCSIVGVDRESVTRYAEQRALRVVIAQRGAEEAARLSRQAFDKQFSTEELSDEEATLMPLLMSMSIDGVVAALRAHRNSA
jgi:hypothetical protein